VKILIWTLFMLLLGQIERCEQRMQLGTLMQLLVSSTS
jgi:hypothetical protein